MSSLSFDEYCQIVEHTVTELTAEQEELVADYRFRENPVSGAINVTFFDDNYEPIATVPFASLEHAEVYCEDILGFDSEDHPEVEYDDE